MHRIVPTILEQSRVISKGKGYDEKLNRRKAVIYSQIQSTKVAGRTSGSNNLSAKNINEKKYLSRVTGMALTNAQKKKLAKKQARLQAKQSSEDEDWESADEVQEAEEVKME